MADFLPRLGVNIDHIATLRQLRGTPYPNVVDAAKIAVSAGAQQITVHLREDRRHIQDDDVKKLRSELGALGTPLNLEMAADAKMVRIASRLKVDWACLVPEKRQEVTTEGGLDLARGRRRIQIAVKDLRKAGVRVSLFIEPSLKAVKLSRELGADAVELHTGRFCIAAQGGAKHAKSSATAKAAKAELERIRAAAALARELGLGSHAGHGFDAENVRDVAALRDAHGRALVDEYNIGHAIVCRAALVGLERAVREMIAAIQAP